jgi:peptidyl-prolyl cis-trans isomerase C
MNTFQNKLLVALLCGGIAATAAAQPAKPAAKAAGNGAIVVNGKTIAPARTDILVKEQIAQGAPDGEQLRTMVREQVIRMEVLAQAARAAGTDKKAEVQQQMDMARDTVLVRNYLQNYAENYKPGDDALRKEYDTIKASVGDKEYKVRHILMETEDEAKAVIAKLGKGEKFEKLAEESKDPGSKGRGGDLGWANQTNFVKPFSDAMVKLEKGKYTTAPVKSEFGWHVIQLEDVRPTKVPSFEEAKPGLAQRMQKQAVEQHILDLRQKAKVQ